MPSPPAIFLQLHFLQFLPVCMPTARHLQDTDLSCEEHDVWEDPDVWFAWMLVVLLVRLPLLQHYAAVA